MLFEALWLREIELEHPPGSDVFERAKPVDFILGDTAAIAQDVSRWFSGPKFSLVDKRSGVLPDQTRVFYFRGSETLWRVRYIVHEKTINVAGLRDIPLTDDPVYTKREGWAPDF